MYPALFQHHPSKAVRHVGEDPSVCEEVPSQTSEHAPSRRGPPSRGCPWRLTREKFYEGAGLTADRLYLPVKGLI